jgi:hypothetical protein
MPEQTTAVAKPRTEEELDEFRAACKRNLWFFISNVLGGIPIDGAVWLREDIHGPMCDFLQGPSTVKDLCGFRGCLKTTLLSGFLVWLAVKRPSISILLCSKIDKNAASTIHLVKHHWEHNHQPPRCPTRPNLRRVRPRLDHHLSALQHNNLGRRNLR